MAGRGQTRGGQASRTPGEPGRNIGTWTTCGVRPCGCPGRLHLVSGLHGPHVVNRQNLQAHDESMSVARAGWLIPLATLPASARTDRGLPHWGASARVIAHCFRRGVVLVAVASMKKRVETREVRNLAARINGSCRCLQPRFGTWRAQKLNTNKLGPGKEASVHTRSTG